MLSRCRATGDSVGSFVAREPSSCHPHLSADVRPIKFISPIYLIDVKIITLDVNHALRYYFAMIISFRCSETEALANGRRIARFLHIESVARRKLRQLQIAGRLEDLRVPPGNRLEKLKGARTGQYSIRVNDQFRVCFRWSAAGAKEVEIVDYH